MYVILLSCSCFFRSSLIVFLRPFSFFVSSAHIIGCVWAHIFCLVGRYVTGMIADMPSHIRTLFLFLDPVRILSCFASSSHHSDSLSIHSCLRSYRREYNKGTSLILFSFYSSEQHKLSIGNTKIKIAHYEICQNSYWKL